jgi:predicted phage-related endonuclease
MLTAAQLEERRRGVGSSDARKIMAGDWYDLWAEKTGRVIPPPILSPWDALLRHHIEPAILDYWEQVHDCDLIYRGDAIIHPTVPIIRSTLDGYDDQEGRVVDAKLLNQFTPDKGNWIIDRYGWQMVHQMATVQCDKGSLYISIHMAKPYRVDWERDHFQEAMYIDRVRQFWSYVEQDKEPPGAPPVEAPVPVELMRELDMTGNNEWGSFAAQWLENADAAKKAEAAIKGLKGMVPKDVSRAHCPTVELIRKANGLHIRKVTDAES